MEEMVTIGLTHELKMSRDWWELFDKAEQIAHKEATKLYRLAWRMTEHNCSEEAIRKCREEARTLHEGVGANPAWFLDWFGAHKFVYAFKF